MSELHEYEISLPSGDATVQLTEEEAEARGLRRVERKAQTAAANKSAEPENKARTTAQKRADVAARSFGGRKNRDG